MRELLRARNDWTQSSLAAEIGISRQRIQQLVIENDLPVRKHWEVFPKKTFTCSICNELMKRQTKDGCHLKCRLALRTLHYTCTNCGKEFDRPYNQRFQKCRRTDPEKSRPFCCRPCYREWVSKMKGTGLYWREGGKQPITKICKGCGTDFKTRIYSQVFHSWDCFKLSRKSGLIVD